MGYAVYFAWNDGFEDSFNVENAKDRDMNIKEMIARGDLSQFIMSEFTRTANMVNM